jgi:chromate transporter
LPSLISVMIVSRVWARYKNSHIVQNMFAGIRPVVVGLVGAAAVLVGLATFRSLSSGIHGLYTLVLGGLTFYGVAFRKWDPIKVLVGAALIGLIVYR